MSGVSGPHQREPPVAVHFQIEEEDPSSKEIYKSTSFVLFNRVDWVVNSSRSNRLFAEEFVSLPG